MPNYQRIITNEQIRQMKPERGKLMAHVRFPYDGDGSVAVEITMDGAYTLLEEALREHHIVEGMLQNGNLYLSVYSR